MCFFTRHQKYRRRGVIDVIEAWKKDYHIALCRSEGVRQEQLSGKNDVPPVQGRRFGWRLM
jgi:hypothetical protein